MSLGNELHQEPRRSFLKVVTGILAGMLGALTTLPGLAMLLHPAARETVRGGRRPLRVASLRELRPGRPLRVDVRGELVDAWSRIPDVKLGSCWLVREPPAGAQAGDGQGGGDGQVRAFSTVCPHLGCGIELDEQQQRFACPCHGSHFDLTSGLALSGPSPRAMDELEVIVDGEDVKVTYRRFRVGVAAKEEV
jgi:menaquinol-cytochrome c reductase iron-sulfur subunit